jgi:hypothetical protein
MAFNLPITLLREGSLLGNDHETGFHGSEITLNNRGTAGNAVLYAVRAKMLQQRQV